MKTNAAAILALALLLASGSGCMFYWEDVQKQQEENFELADELRWQAGEEETKAKKAREANAPEADPSLRPGDF